MSSRSLSNTLLAVLLASLLLGCGSGDSPEDAQGKPAKVPKVPFDKPLKLLISPFRQKMASVFEPLAQSLGSRLGAKVHIDIAASYDDAIERISKGEVDLCFMPGLSYIRASRQNSALRILVSEEIRGTLYDRAVLIVRAGSEWRHTKDLPGRRFALVSKHSATGYHYPRAYFKKLGYKLETVLSDDKVVFAGDHDRALSLLLEKKVDVAATYDWAVTYPNGRLRPDIHVVAWSEPLPHSLMVARAGFSPVHIQALREAFLALNRKRLAGREVLPAMERIGITGFAMLPESALDSLRRLERESGQ